jgi:hypothetical protein
MSVVSCVVAVLSVLVAVVLAVVAVDEVLESAASSVVSIWARAEDETAEIDMREILSWRRKFDLTRDFDRWG